MGSNWCRNVYGSDNLNCFQYNQLQIVRAFAIISIFCYVIFISMLYAKTVRSLFAASTALLACTSRWKDTFSQRTVGMGLRRLSALMVIGCSLFSVVCVCGQLSTCAVCCVRSRDD